ncbi:MAG TPA: Na+/H+ antiporter subunit E [Burkholderiales bacterium]|jgi:multicomponent K+:H+ antiporter subunit E|nr:Na+/H+ antiporter subunit E [Burkholderiales bacterium]
MMTRWLPYPLVSLLLAATWLLLNGSVAWVHVITAIVLGLAGGRMLARLQAPEGRTRRRIGAAVRLLWLFLVDIVRSNIAVFRIVVHPDMKGCTSGFLLLPLQLRHPGGLAVLACIITATPGTSWARYDSLRNVLTIHVLDLVDEQAWIAQFKDRYERHLLEIFQ